MRVLIAASSLTLIAACGQSVAPQADAAPAPQTVTEAATPIATETPVEDVKVVAVLSYADWCGSCKALDPKIEAVKSANTFEGVKFARIDYTDKDADAFFTEAAALGVDTALKSEFEAKIKTGKMYLISVETGEIISRVDKTMTEADISAALTNSVA